MAEVKWIKIVTDIFDDEKILLIESMPDRDAVIVIWFKLLCLAGKQNNGGVFMLNDKIAYTDEMLSTIFRRPINTVRLALDTFQHFGMIEIVNDCITIPNWNRHQSLDALEKKREYQRQLMKKRREEQRQIACNANCDANCDANGKTNGDTNCEANVSRLEREEEREGEGDKKEREERETRTRAPLSHAPAVENVEISNGEYVELKNFPLVKITKEELRHLRKLDLSATRKSLDSYFASMTVQINRGRVYSNHFEHIRKWAMQDGAKISNSSIDSDVLDKIMNPYSA